MHNADMGRLILQSEMIEFVPIILENIMVTTENDGYNLFTQNVFNGLLLQNF